MKKSVSILFSIFASLMLFAGVASAHVNVYPKEVTQGTYEVFTVRVPNESESPTTKVEVKFPVQDVAVSRVEAKPGWNYELVKNDDGKVTGVIWTAAGDGLLASEFGDFKISAKVGDGANQIIWKAYQTYKDGNIVEWIGGDGADKPASVTLVKPKPAGSGTDSHGNAISATTSNDSASSSQSPSDLPLYLSIAAVVLSATALLVSLIRKK